MGGSKPLVPVELCLAKTSLWLRKLMRTKWASCKCCLWCLSSLMESISLFFLKLPYSRYSQYFRVCSQMSGLATLNELVSKQLIVLSKWPVTSIYQKVIFLIKNKNYCFHSGPWWMLRQSSVSGEENLRWIEVIYCYFWPYKSVGNTRSHISYLDNYSACLRTSS